MKKNVPLVFIILSIVFLCISVAFFFSYAKYPHLADYNTSKRDASIICMVIAIVLLIIDRTLRLIKLQDTMNDIKKKLDNKEL